MIYMGSKARIAKHILPIILKDRKPGQYYVEPFAGGCNSLDKVENPRIGNDVNHYLIALLIALQNGWQMPEELSREEYNTVKNNPEAYPAEYVGFVGFCCSYGCKWWGGYSGVGMSHGKLYDYIRAAVKNLSKQQPFLNGIEFSSGSYKDVAIPACSIVYCDPPYKGTTGYKVDFNHADFWQWCRDLKKAGHQVFISEYEAPEDFKCIWSTAVGNYLSNGIKKGTAIAATEKLFTL